MFMKMNRKTRRNTALVGRGGDDHRLDLLRRIAEAGGSVEPQADPQARRGYDFPTLGADSDADLAFLAKRDYLEECFVDRVSLCPKCSSHHLNQREVCPRCGCAQLAAEALLRHQPCGYVGRISEFAAGAQIDAPLACPSCHQPLDHSPSDYAQIGRTFACRECGLAVDEPPVEALCLSCGIRVPAESLSSADFFRYRLSPLGRMALRRGALLGREEELRVIGGARIYPPPVTRALLAEETRQLSRSRRGISVLLIECGSDAPRTPWLRHLRDKLRDVDVIGQLGDHAFVAILPQTGKRGAEALRQRILGELRAHPPISVTPLEITTPQQLDAYLNRPGRPQLPASA